MEFFIRQNSELPILKMQVVKDGRTNANKVFDKDLDTATIRFSMKNELNGIPKILMNNAYLTEKTQMNPDSPIEISFDKIRKITYNLFKCQRVIVSSRYEKISQTVKQT